VPSLKFEHILPGQDVNLAVAVKFEGERHFYGFSNLSYAHNFKNEEWRIDENSVKIELEVVASNNERINKCFVIYNPNGSISGFRLKEDSSNETSKSGQ
jgi:hypothetical protein